MVSSAPRDWIRQNDDWLREKYPEMAIARDVREVMEVDRYRASQGRTPSAFTRDVTHTAAESIRRREPPPPTNFAPQTMESFRASLRPQTITERGGGRVDVDLSRYGDGQFGNLRDVREEAYDRDRLGIRGTGVTIPERVFDLTNLSRAGGAFRGSVARSEQAGDPFRGTVGAVRGAVEGFRDPDRFPAEDASLTRELVDAGVPEGVAALGVDVLFDPIDLATGGLVATDLARLGRRGVRALSDDAAQTAIRAAEGPLERSTRGVLDLAPPRFPGARVAGGADVSASIADVAPFSLRATPLPAPDEILRTTQSDAVRSYVQRATEADEVLFPGRIQALEQASAAVRTDPQGVISRTLGNVPGLREVRNWDRPGLVMERRLLEGHIARHGVENALLTGQANARYDAIRLVDDFFGEGASTGGKVLEAARANVDDLHRVTINGRVLDYPGSGTVYDFLQRPYAYTLDDQAREVLQAWARTDEGMRVITNEQFGTDIGKFVSERGGAYVPNVDISESRLAMLEGLARSETQDVARGATKPRVWESGFDRWVSDARKAATGAITDKQVFKPQTDLHVLGYGGDYAKARAAGNQTFRSAIGGKTLTEVREEINPALFARRQEMQQQLQSLRGRISRAEDSLRRDNTVAARLETQGRQAASRADDLAARTGDQLDDLDLAIRELDRRAEAIDATVRNVRGRADYTRQGIELLRDDLADLKLQYADVKQAYEAQNLRDYVRVQEAGSRYFRADEARQVQQLLSQAADNDAARIAEGFRSQVLAGDVGPLTGIQGIILMAARPRATMRALAGGLADAARSGDLFRPFRDDSMQAFIRQNSDLVQEYAFYTGRAPGGRLLSEIGQGGLLARIPGFQSFNEGMFNVVTRRQIEMYAGMKDDLVRLGYTADEAAAAASDIANKVIPLMTTQRLGQGARRAQAERILPISLGFIRQPLALMEEAATAVVKAGTGQKLTPREVVAAHVYGRMIAGIVGISVASAAFNAVARGDDPVDAILNALDPGSRSFMGLSAGDQTVPLANAFRSPIRASIGTVRNALNLAVEPATGQDIGQQSGASPIDYFVNRIGPAFRALGDAYGVLTAPPWERPETERGRLAQLVGTVASGAAPIPVQGIGEEIARQRGEGEFDPVRLAQVATTETAGFSLIPEEAQRTLDVRARSAYGDSFDALSFRDQEQVLADNPDIADRTYRARREQAIAELEPTGLAQIPERAWDEIAEGFGIAQDYEAFREATIADFTEQYREARAADPATEATNAFGRLPAVRAYREYLSVLRNEWASAHMDDGALLDAMRYNLIPSNATIRELASLAE